jgi:hypothetical protein
VRCIRSVLTAAVVMMVITVAKAMPLFADSTKGSA